MSVFTSLLSEHAADFLSAYAHRLTPEIRQAVGAMCCCRTELSGQSHWACDHCAHRQSQPLSCGHRHCPQCQQDCNRTWLLRQASKLLPCDYFLLTLTIPAQLRFLAQVQPKAFYGLMFEVGSSVLKDFAQRQHGGQSGLTLVLHTHSRKRTLHPHLHAVIPAGFYHTQRHQWHKGPRRFLYPATAMAKVWRARLLAAIAKHPRLSLPQASTPEAWVVDCRAVGRGLPTLKYLSRYLYRGVIADSDIVSSAASQVTFRYQDAQSGQRVFKTMPVLDFLWHILQHVLPKGFQRVRDYGLLHGAAKKRRHQIQLIICALQTPLPDLNMRLKSPEKSAWRCPCCEAGVMHCVGVSRPSQGCN